jgi:hypothetical protein
VNIWKGLDHQIKVFSSRDGKGLRSKETKRSKDMSARQWKRWKKAARRNEPGRGEQAA